jgi:hypothetical protein
VFAPAPHNHTPIKFSFSIHLCLILHIGPNHANSSLAIHQRVTDRAYLLCMLALSSIASSCLSRSPMASWSQSSCPSAFTTSLAACSVSPFPIPGQVWYVLLWAMLSRSFCLFGKSSCVTSLRLLQCESVLPLPTTGGNREIAREQANLERLV